MDKSVFTTNAERLRTLQKEVHDNFAAKKRDASKTERWRDSARRFHEEYDRLAFPGGLAVGYEALLKDDVMAVEMAIRFLEADPWFYRSGYIKADFIARLKKITLTNEQRLRLQRVIVDRIKGHDTREFRAYSSLSRAVADFEFVVEIESLVGSIDKRTTRHARWVLEHLRQDPNWRIK